MTAQNPDAHNETDSWAGNPREVRVGELINEFLDLRASGTPVTPQEFTQKHPDFAEELSRHFEGLGMLDRLAGSSDGTIQADRSDLVKSIADDAPLPQIQGYELLREIGRGGMGVVYKALQRSTQRVVALKLLLEGSLASDSNRKRFEREIALAAQLRHPNIIPIYDSGVTDGRMFFAMEYVHGRPMHAHVTERRPSLEDKLRLFAQTCRAISHAHQRGVIHRDIKPSNILVDADGSPFVHDFGLAKAGSIQDVTLSMTAHLVGTPAYMSPEQVAGDPGGIDTRTDIYSLGVILFELLTGEPPYDVRGSLSDVLNNISHAEPARPSRLNPRVIDELETIVLLALEKRKEASYKSVAELSGDVER
ncbi:MAG: serine/threonine-protein kinase, partial [Phycisphaerae bacterium]